MIEKMGRSIQTVQSDYEQLVTTRKRQLEKPLGKIEEISEKIKLPAGQIIIYPSTSLHSVETVTNGQRINIKVGGITFQCNEDSYGSDHPYPRSTDPVAGKWLLSLIHI